MPRKKPADYERIRGSKACTFCSRRKVKCDGIEPCSTCQTRQIECVFVEGKKRGPPSKIELQKSQEAVAAPSFALGSSSSPTYSLLSDVNDPDLPPYKRARFHHDGSYDAHSYLQPASALNDLANVAYHSRNTASKQPQQHLSTFNVYDMPTSNYSEHDTGSTRTSLSHYERESPMTLSSDSTTPRFDSFVAGEGHCPQANVRTRGSIRGDAESPTRDLSKQVIDQLITIYQSFVHLHWPIIYLPSLSSLHVLADTHPLLFHAVLAVAAGTQDTTGQEDLTSGPLTSSQGGSGSTRASGSQGGAHTPPVCPPGTTARLVKYLRKRVQAQNLAKTLETIQVLILLALVEMGGGELSDASVHASMACVLAIDLGLHRQQSGPHTAQLYRTEERQRALWGCYVLDKSQAAALERPMMLRSDDIDVPLPSVDERDEYDIFVNDRSRHFISSDRVAVMSEVKCRCISSFDALCKLMMLLERIMTNVYSPRARSDRREGNTRKYKLAVVELDAELRSWRKDLPPHLQWTCEYGGELLEPSLLDSDLDGARFKETSGNNRRPSKAASFKMLPGKQDSVPPQVLTMRAWYSACVLLLHRPRLPSDPRPNGYSVPSRGDQHQAAASVQQELEGKLSGSTPSLAHAKRVQTVIDVPGSDLVRAAATEICLLLPKYKSTFSMRRIPSSWVYLIFQSAIIHSSFLGSDGEIEYGSPADNEAATGSRKQSERLFRECIQHLEQLSLTWRGASHRVATLRRVAESCRMTRPPTPVLGAAAVPNAPSVTSTTKAAQEISNSTLLLSQPFVGSSDEAAQTDVRPDAESQAASQSQTSAVLDGAGVEWLDFWSQMPSSSEDVWSWQQFMDSFSSNGVPTM